jgi:uncharacterized protein
MAIPILSISSGFVHPSLAARLTLQRIFARSHQFKIFGSSTLEELPGLDWGGFDALVLYFHRQRISSMALAALDEYTRRGGGVLAIHSASASFKEEPAYHKFLGGRFTHHGETQAYRVEPDTTQRNIFGIAAPFILHDELYCHEWDPSSTVHFWVNTPTTREPLVWTRYNGEGRICYCAAGDSAASLNTPQIQQILIRGLRWVATSEY